MVTKTTEITDRVFESLMHDPRTEGAVIDITIERGILTLIGSVDTVETRAAAEEIARQQDGIVSVINQLKVK